MECTFVIVKVFTPEICNVPQQHISYFFQYILLLKDSRFIFAPIIKLCLKFNINFA